MRITEMIERLTALRTELGDVEVLVTDGFNAECYRGNYTIESWWEDDLGQWCVDIGIGGCREE